MMTMTLILHTFVLMGQCHLILTSNNLLNIPIGDFFTSLAMWFIYLLPLIVQIFCVDRNNFRTCKESSFCTRQRDHSPSVPEYSVVKNSILASPTIVSAAILSRESIKSLNITITYHSNSVFRITLDETNPIRPRYRTEIGDALEHEPIKLPITSKLDKDELLIVGSSDDSAIIHLDPFKLSILHKGQPLVTINERTLLKFEHQLEHPPTIVPEPSNDENAENVSIPAPPEPEDWSETFRGHRDSRPHGPTSVGIDINFPGFDHVYGIPEHADSFALRNTDSTDPYRLYNLDVFEYELNNPMALYGAVPVMWSHRENATVGIFWNNPTETWIDIKSNKGAISDGLLSKLFSRNDAVSSRVDTRWMSETGVIDIFVIVAENPSAGMKAYASLTGTTKLPPLFALAHHQSRWNYKDAADVKAVSDNYDKHNIPMDVMWLDIEYANGKRYFGWDKSNFPQPDVMVEDLISKGRQLVVVFDPHIKRDSNWAIFKDGETKDVYIKTATNTTFDGWCWPGSSSWPDFLRHDVETWWAELFQTPDFLDPKLMFYAWNDMNEPSVFNGAEVTIAKDVLHNGVWENRDVHNMFGLRVHRATWEGLLQRSHKKERPFVLTRAFFAGSQRTSAVWTGDNKASWDHLQIATPMLLSLSMTGITFCGSDVGGFFNHPSNELYTRWYQAAAFHPFVRSHSHMDSPRREPWLMDAIYTNAIKNALAVRYSLLPYWYTLFAMGEYDAQPPMAPMLLHFPTDPITFNIDNQFMVGDAILVHPVVHEGAVYVEPYLPKGVWYLHEQWKVYSGSKRVHLLVELESMPFFYRGGRIVPKKARLRRSSALMINDPYTIIICLDPSQDTAFGHIYYDDFHSTNLTNAHLFRMEYTTMKSYNLFSMKRLPRPGTNIARDFIDEMSPKIERVVVVGLTDIPSEVIAISKESNEERRLNFSFKPPEMANGGDGTCPGLLVIRKPEVTVGDTWKIKIGVGSNTLDDEL